MKISLSDFVTAYDGKSIDYDGIFPGECVDLVNKYADDVIGARPFSTPLTGGASDIWNIAGSADSSKFTRVSMPAIPIIGDVVVYGEPYGRHIENGKQLFWGHVVIYIGNDRILEQNSRKYHTTTISPYSPKYAIGIIRPRDMQPHDDAQDVPHPTTKTNTYKIKPGDTFWDLEDTLNITHGTLQTLNPELDPRNLQIGEEIKINGQSDIALQKNTTYYTIKPGDTFWDLEDAWQLPHGRLQELNPADDPRELQIGQRIKRS